MFKPIPIPKTIYRGFNYFKSRESSPVNGAEITKFGKFLAIDARNGFHNLKNQIFDHKYVDIIDAGDIHPFRDGPVFIGATTLYVRNCNKNFVYYWVDNQTFPNIEEVYLMSHPCEPVFFRRFSKETFNHLRKLDPNFKRSPPTLYLEESFGTYIRRWAPDMDNIKKVTEEHIYRMLGRDMASA